MTKIKRQSRPSRKKKRNSQKSASGNTYLRAQIIRAGLYLIAVCLFARMVQIQIFYHDRYAAFAREQYTQEYTQKAPRGIIYDRNYTTIALNEERFDIGVYKRAVTDMNALCSKLAGILGGTKNEFRRKLKKEGSFIVLERDILAEDAKVIEILKMPGVKITRASERLYPFKETLSQVIGFADVDGRGLSGIELEFDSKLKGNDGWSILQKDARGKNIMPIASQTRESQSGDNIVITIDQAIQAIAEEELNHTVATYHAKGGTIIIINPATGEVLSMVSWPGFDANSANKTNPGAWRIRAVTDIFEPGSTFKIVTMMLALQDTARKADDLFYCENGTYKLFGETINDPETHSWLTLTDVFKHSSNIGTAKIALEFGKEKLFSAARDFGFGNKTNIELPGEVSGILKKPSDWSRFTTAAISYGHEVAVTALQMAMAYGAIANGGLLMKPSIIKEIHSPTNDILYEFKPKVIRKVMSARVAGKMTRILKQVVEEGTGIQAKIQNVSLAGKTGTAQKPKTGSSGYSNSNFVASFVGFYPAEQAKLLIYAAIDEPYPIHSGGSVAAPAVRRILKKVISIYEKPKPIRSPQLTGIKPSKEPHIPDVSGRSLEVAAKVLSELGLQYETEGQGSFIKGQRTLQQDNKQRVILELAEIQKETGYTTMPNLMGLSLRKAISELSRHGLSAKIGGSGQVALQQPDPGSKMKIGSRGYLECKPAASVNLLANEMSSGD